MKSIIFIDGKFYPEDQAKGVKMAAEQYLKKGNVSIENEMEIKAYIKACGFNNWFPEKITY